jgi:hypothetical protein
MDGRREQLTAATGLTALRGELSGSCRRVDGKQELCQWGSRGCGQRGRSGRSGWSGRKIFTERLNGTMRRGEEGKKWLSGVVRHRAEEEGAGDGDILREKGGGSHKMPCRLPQKELGVVARWERHCSATPKKESVRRSFELLKLRKDDHPCIVGASIELADRRGKRSRRAQEQVMGGGSRAPDNPLSGPGSIAIQPSCCSFRSAAPFVRQSFKPLPAILWSVGASKQA